MPGGVAGGMMHAIDPPVVVITIPICVGEAKLPDASLNCAVNILPALKVPVMVYGTFSDAPWQYVSGDTVAAMLTGSVVEAMMRTSSMAKPGSLPPRKDSPLW